MRQCGSRLVEHEHTRPRQHGFGDLQHLPLIGAQLLRFGTWIDRNAEPLENTLGHILLMPLAHNTERMFLDTEEQVFRHGESRD